MAIDRLVTIRILFVGGICLMCLHMYKDYVYVAKYGSLNTMLYSRGGDISDTGLLCSLIRVSTN